MQRLEFQHENLRVSHTETNDNEHTPLVLQPRPRGTNWKIVSTYAPKQWNASTRRVLAQILVAQRFAYLWAPPPAPPCKQQTAETGLLLDAVPVVTSTLLVITPITEGKREYTRSGHQSQKGRANIQCPYTRPGRRGNSE
eukprot:1192382-Prorocentrum_minimum.AAC.1